MSAVQAMSSNKNTSMSLLRTPSIAQQRIILIVLAAVIGASAWWQTASNHSNYSVQKFSTTPSPEIVSQLDFTDAEAAWSGLTIDSHGNFQIDARTDTALSDAIALIRDQPSKSASELAMARMALLLEKQFGVTASRQIMELVPALKNYKEAEQRFWEENGNKNPPPHAELFQLQDQILGAELAKTLFSQQRRLARTMLASQQIQNDARLTQAEKDQALRELQKTLQAEGASSD
jgi:hypothetical protein